MSLDLIGASSRNLEFGVPIRPGARLQLASLIGQRRPGPPGPTT
jgi:hypothetical protein